MRERITSEKEERSKKKLQGKQDDLQAEKEGKENTYVDFVEDPIIPREEEEDTSLVDEPSITDLASNKTDFRDSSVGHPKSPESLYIF